MALGWTEILVLGVLAVLIFGDDLPKVTKQIASYVHEVRNSFRGIF